MGKKVIIITWIICIIVFPIIMYRAWSLSPPPDTTDPVITINLPIAGVYNEAPPYNITITEVNLDQFWYTVNGSSRIYITSLTGTIDSRQC